MKTKTFFRVDLYDEHTAFPKVEVKIYEQPEEQTYFSDHKFTIAFQARLRDESNEHMVEGRYSPINHQSLIEYWFRTHIDVGGVCVQTDTVIDNAKYAAKLLKKCQAKIAKFNLAYRFPGDDLAQFVGSLVHMGAIELSLVEDANGWKSTAQEEKYSYKVR